MQVNSKWQIHIPRTIPCTLAINISISQNLAHHFVYICAFFSHAMKSGPTFQNTIFNAAILNTNFFKPSSFCTNINFRMCFTVHWIYLASCCIYRWLLMATIQRKCALASPENNSSRQAGMFLNCLTRVININTTLSCSLREEILSIKKVYIIDVSIN